MDHQNRRYTSDEVSDIVRSALDSRGGSSDTIGHEELLEIAQQSGVSRDEIEEALDKKESSAKFDKYKLRWFKKQKKEFHDHLKFFFIVNAIILFFDIRNGGLSWPHWWVGIWGVFVVIHAFEAYIQNDEKAEKGALEMLNEDLKEKEKRRQEKFEALMEEYD